MLKRLLLKSLISEISYRDKTILKPRGFIVELWFDPQWTEFDLKQYVKLSRRHRRTKKSADQDKPVLQYSMMGKCISFRQRGISSSLTLRNVISLCSFEMTYALFSINITTYIIHDLFKENKRLHYKRASRYELRRHSPVKSQTDFDFVIEDISYIEHFWW